MYLKQKAEADRGWTKATGQVKGSFLPQLNIFLFNSPAAMLHTHRDSAPVANHWVEQNKGATVLHVLKQSFHQCVKSCSSVISVSTNMCFYHMTTGYTYTIHTATYVLYQMLKKDKTSHLRIKTPKWHQNIHYKVPHKQPAAWMSSETLKTIATEISGIC